MLSEIEQLLDECSFINIKRVNDVPGPATLYVAHR